jgi:hypothetical protein
MPASAKGPHRVEAAERHEIARGRNRDIVRIAAIARPARLGRIAAQLLLALAAEAATAAAPAREYEDGAQARRFARDLVPQHQRQLQSGDGAVDHVEVGMAYARTQHAHDDALAIYLRHRPLLETQGRPKRVKDRRLHRDPARPSCLFPVSARRG